MNVLRTITGFLASRSLTLWLVGAFLLFYISIAVWSQEAFAAFVNGLTTNALVMFAYLLFSVNVLLRGASALGRIRHRRMLFLLKLPLYAGTVLLIFSFFLSLNLRQQRWMIAGEGDRFRLAWEDSAFHVRRVDIPLSRDMLVTKDSALFAYEPVVMVADHHGTLHPVGAFPPAKVQASLLHILIFGIGPGVELRSRGEVVHRGEIALRLLPFGSADTFELPPYPYLFHVSILPTRTVKKGKETAREYDLAMPRYRVEVVKGDTTIAKAETEEAVSFDGTMSLRFFTPSPWAQLEAVHDPFRGWFIAGWALLLSGLFLLPAAWFQQRRQG